MTRIRQFTALLLTLTLIGALTPMPVHAQSLYVATEQLTVDSTAGGVPFTSTKIVSPAGVPALTAACRLQDAEVRYTVSPDQTVTTTLGTQLEVNDWLVIKGQFYIQRFKAIRTTGTSGKMNCTYTNP